MADSAKLKVEELVASIVEGVITVDERLHIVLFNPAAEQMFGRSREEMTGQPLGALIPERFRARHDEHVREFAVTGQTNRSMGKYGLIYGRRASGEEFPIEATISQAGAAGSRQFTVILRDVTERLHADQALRDSMQRLRMLSRRLFEVEETQRRRLARELHDRVGQNVTALSLNLEMMRGELPPDIREKMSMRLSDCETLLFHTDKLVRDVMADLRPPGLDEMGLLAALTEHVRQVADRSGFSATITGTPLTPRLPPAAEIMLFRIAQEALVNVAKHAGATEVAIRLESDPGAVALTIADNGLGFDSAARPKLASGHLGMVNMQERAESIGARLRVESAPGRGTRITVEVPREAETSGG